MNIVLVMGINRYIIRKLLLKFVIFKIEFFSVINIFNIYS